MEKTSRPRLARALRLTALTLVAALTLAPTTMAAPSHVPLPKHMVTQEQTNAQPKKDEVVYATMGLDGEINEIAVVNAFLDSNGTINDSGNYTQTVNLTNDDEIKRNGNNIRVTTKPGDFYYQGNLSSTNMPWLVGFKYYLDGNEITPENLAGKSGQLKIIVDVKQNKNIDSVYFDNYLLQISVNLPNEHFKEVEAKDATIASASNTTVVNLALMPQTERQFEITARATQAYLGQIQIAGLPFSMALDLPNLDQYTSDLVKLRDAISQLNNGIQSYGAGVNQLANGVESYTSGVNQLAGGVEQLASKLGEVNTALDQLAPASQQLAGGLNDYASGMHSFANGLAGAAAGSNDLSAGLTQAAAGAKKLSDSGAQIRPLIQSATQAADMIDQLINYLKTLDPNDINPIAAQLHSLATQLQNLAAASSAAQMADTVTRLDAAIAANDQAIEDLDAVAAALANPNLAALGADPNSSDTQTLTQYMANQAAELTTISSELKTQQDELRAVSAQLTALSGRLAAISQTATAMANAANQVADTLEDLGAPNSQTIAKLEGFSQQLRAMFTGLGAYLDGVDQLSEALNGRPATPTDPGQEGLASGLNKLSAGLSDLSTAAGGLAGGADKLAGGASQLSDGVVQLRDGFRLIPLNQFGGINTLVTGGNTLATGARELASGTGALTSGAQQLADSTADIDVQMKQKMTAELEKFQPKDFQLISFVDPTNTDVERVQFVYVANAQTTPKAEEPAEDKTKTSSWWQRILELFK